MNTPQDRLLEAVKGLTESGVLIWKKYRKPTGFAVFQDVIGLELFLSVVPAAQDSIAINGVEHHRNISFELAKVVTEQVTKAEEEEKQKDNRQNTPGR